MLGIPVLACTRSEAETALTLQINKADNLPGGITEEDMKYGDEKFQEWDERNIAILTEMFDSSEKVDEYRAIRSSYFTGNSGLMSRLHDASERIRLRQQWLQGLKSELTRFKDSSQRCEPSSDESMDVMRLRVLKAIYDRSDASPATMVMYHDIETDTGVDSRTMTGILIYLEQKGLIRMGGEWAEITGAGIDQIEGMQKRPEKPTSIFPANIYNQTFHVHDGGVQQVGNHNTQHNRVSINTDFDNAIERLVAAIESSSLQPLQKISVKSDVVVLRELATLEKTPDVIDAANTRLDAIKEVVSMTADLTSLGTPVLPILWAVFGR